MSDHCEIFTQFFLDPEVISSSHIMFINDSTKEFTLVNHAFPSHDVAFEHLLGILQDGCQRLLRT